MLVINRCVCVPWAELDLCVGNQSLCVCHGRSLISVLVINRCVCVPWAELDLCVGNQSLCVCAMGGA